MANLNFKLVDLVRLNFVLVLYFCLTLISLLGGNQGQVFAKTRKGPSCYSYLGDQFKLSEHRDIKRLCSEHKEVLDSVKDFFSPEMINQVSEKC